MPKYLTQKLTDPVSGKEHWFYAVQNEHNHDAGVEFTKFAKKLMHQQYPTTDENKFTLGHWAKEQAKPASGNELKYDQKSKKWSQAK